MKQQRPLRILVAFFALMLTLTVVSRAADSVTVARVNMEPVKRGALLHRTILEGAVEATEKHCVYSDRPVRIQTVHVREGDTVQRGAALYTLDLEEVRKEAEKIQAELLRLQAEAEQRRLDVGGSAADQAALDRAGEELQRALDDDAFNRMLNDGKQMQADRRRIEDAQNRLTEAERQQRENSRKNQLQLQASESDLALKQQEYDELQGVLAQGGVIHAPFYGIIEEVLVQEGKTVGTGETLCTIIPGNAGAEFIGEMDSEKAKYLKAGDPVSVLPTGKTTPLREAVIKSLATSEGKTTVTVSLSGAEQEQMCYGQSATMTHESRTDEYAALVPLSALRGSEGDYYVLTAEEQNTILGSELIAVRRPVTLLEKDNQHAAVEGGVSGGDQVIARSNKPVSEEDRVREISKTIDGGQ